MASLVESLTGTALNLAQSQGLNVSIRLNAWPGEIKLADARDIGGGGPGIVKAQVIMRDAGGRVVSTIGQPVQQNWPLTAAVVGGLGLLAFIIVRGIAHPHRSK